MELTPDIELKEADDRYSEMADMDKCMQKLDEKGYTDQYKIENGRLHCLSSGLQFAPQDVIAVNFYRFEGISNPDDMAILYAIETIDGRKGVLINAYGLYADAAVEQFMMEVEMHKSVKGVQVY